MKQVIQRLVSVIDQCAARTSVLPLESVALLPAHCGRFSMTCLEKLFKLCRFILILSLPTVCHFITTLVIGGNPLVPCSASVFEMGLAGKWLFLFLQEKR
jgi:hypothetical protein